MIAVRNLVFLRFLRGFRTVAANVVAAMPILLDIVLQIMSAPEWRDVVPPQWLPYYALGLTIMNVLLRIDTKTPVGQRE